jgi:hypothetical protein
MVGTHFKNRPDNSQNHIELWKRYSGHRNQLMRLIASFYAAPQMTICILGAGSCADFDLQELSKMFSEVHLVDINSSAIRNGVKNQRAENISNIIIHNSTDITNINYLIKKWSEEEPAQEMIDNCISEMEQDCIMQNLSGRFDIVISSCMMTQLFLAAKKCIASEENKNKMVFALRKQHLQLLLSLTNKNGTALLATDMSAFETEQDFSTAEDCDIHEIMLELIRKKTFFTGANPFAVMNEIKAKKKIISQLRDVIFISPWLWQMFEDRVYLVYALALQKK